jgi:general L-amino acid transport system permease protein
MTDEPRLLEPGLQEPRLLPEEERPPKETLTPAQWLRKRLFNNWYNTLLTLVLLPLVAYLAWRFFAFAVLNARWDPVRRNLTLLMVGRYPRDEMWRIVAQIVIWSSAVGLAWGAAVAGAKARARRSGLPYREDPVLAKVRRYWAVLLLVGLFLAMIETWGPLLVVVASLGSAAVLQVLGARTPGRYVAYLWFAVAVLAVAGFQIVSGFYGSGWLWMGVPVALAAARFVGHLPGPSDRARRLLRLGAAAVVLVAAYLVYAAVDHRGVGWGRWEGLRLNLLAAPIAITLAFPLGLGLALARRSSFPALRLVATGYIELIRGVPLISLLLMGHFFIGFFLNLDTPLSAVTRAVTVLTLFTAAYIAEIVRGGLQGVSRGQVEAGQSVGLTPFRVTRLIVLPQALRNVIPAMVGQFIALTKDTTLLFIISVPELLYVRSIVHAQAEFRAFGIAETLVFVALVFWAITFSMSRESQRLERRLGVGER